MDNGGLWHLHKFAFGQSRCRRNAELVSGEAFFAAEIARQEDCDSRFFSFLRDYGNLQLAGPDIENESRWLALGINNIIPSVIVIPTFRHLSWRG